MSFLCLGLSTKEPVQIDDGGPITTSFPIFIDLMRGLGATLGEVDV
jgi:3-phosphoshikimate 1-carboxyvinyltransferase